MNCNRHITFSNCTMLSTEDFLLILTFIFQNTALGCLPTGIFSTLKETSVIFFSLREQMAQCRFCTPTRSKSMRANDFNSMITYSCPAWGIALIFSAIKQEVNFSNSVYVSNYSLLFQCSFKGKTAHFLKKLYPSTKCYFSLYISNGRFPTFCLLLPYRFNM